MSRRHGFVVPAQPIFRHRPPIGPYWVHEIKHDGYRLMVRRDGTTVRLFTRNAYEFTERFPAIAAAAARLDAGSFTIDGEAMVCGPDGLSLFDELRRRDGAAKAMLWAFDLIEIDGADLRGLAFLERKARLARLLQDSTAGIVLNDHIAGDGAIVFDHACRLGAEGIVSKRIDAPYRSGPCSTWVKCKNPVAIEAQRRRSEIWNAARRSSR